MSWPQITTAAPDLVVVAPCGCHLSGAAEQARIACALPGLPVWAIDADEIIVRPGPRLVTGVRRWRPYCNPATAPPGTIHRVG